MIIQFSELKRWTLLIGLLVSTLFFMNAVHAAGLNDTGITTCSDANQNDLPCPVAGFPGQDAEFGTNGFDFTKLDAAGNALPATATDHTCVRDNVTGLMWQVKLSSWDYTLKQTATYAGTFNATGLCGFKDWRMPNPKELFGIAAHSRYEPAIDTNYFPNTPGSGYQGFWSSLYFAGDNFWGWCVHSKYSDTTFEGASLDKLFVRLVRGGQSFNTFIDNGDGTVTQSNTGLMWAKCSEGQIDIGCTGNTTTMDWSDALTVANNSMLGGYSDWRLPNVKELQALVDYNRYDPAIDSHYFPNTPSSLWFWSNSPYADYSTYTWGVIFYSGGTRNYSRGTYGHVRLVRDVKPSTPLNLTIVKAGTGTVTSAPAGINCGATCSMNFDSGRLVTLTATAVTGSIFSGWSGGGCSGTGTCTVTMNAAQTVTATFTTAPVSFSLSINKVGNGTVSSSDGKINCGSGSGCMANFNSGALVALFATPISGYSFSGWTGCTPIATNPLQCTVTLTSNKTVTANFGASGMADIKVTAIALTPASPAANSIFTAAITVKNQGTVTATGGYLDVWAHQTAVQTCGAQAEWIEVGSLAAGASKTLTVSLRSKGTGSKTLRAFVDSWCVTPEADEANNQLIKTYTVK
ncbi:hypothetical protein CKO09_12055 [Chromatium weissei]|nr:hypothetical protein [Chromatium weissei]